MLHLFTERFSCMAFALTNIDDKGLEDVIMCYTCNPELDPIRGRQYHFVNYDNYGAPHPNDEAGVKV